MQRIANHIDHFNAMLTAKGYDGRFHSPVGYHQTLRDTLTRHALNCYEQNIPIAPMTMITYSHWRPLESRFVQCAFQTDFSYKDGFKVDQMLILYRNMLGVLRHKECRPKNEDEIPTRLEANRIITEHKNRLKL